MSVFDSLTFAPMLITDVFESMRSSSAWYDKNKVSRGPGEYPYVSRSGFSNGHESVIGRQDLPPNLGQAITIGVDTQTVFYQPAPFYTSVKIQVLRHRNLTDLSGPVLVSILRAQMSKFQWGNGASLDRLRVTRVMVPVRSTAQGQVVDWEGMTELGREASARATEWSRPVRQSTNAIANEPLPELTFEATLITEVFETMRASTAWFDKVSLKNGEPTVPYLSQTHSANSVAGIVAHQGVPPEPGNCITVTLKTQATFYQPVSFYTAQNFLLFRHPQLDEYSGILLVAIMRRALSKFSWGYGVSMERLRKTRVMVPVSKVSNGSGRIDWAGMSRYGRVLRARTEIGMAAALDDRGA